MDCGGEAEANMIQRLLSSATACAVVFILTAAAVHAEDTIIIGFGGGLTGNLAFYDGLTRNGAQMAVDEINAAGGIAGRYRIDFQVKDVRSETSASAAAGREFVAAGANRIAVRDLMLVRVEKGAKTLVEMLRPEPADVPAP